MVEITNFLNNGIIKSGVYTCSNTKDQANEVITILHGYSGHTPKIVFAYIEKAGTPLMGEGAANSSINLFLFATVPLVNGLPSTSEISFLMPDIPTIKTDGTRYSVTTDETFQSGVNYYTRTGDEYILATVTVGSDIPANTYYEQFDNHPTEVRWSAYFND